MIKGIIFDFGGVLVTDPSLNISDQEARIFNIESRFLTKIYRDKNLQLFEKGLISGDQFWQRFKENLERKAQIKIKTEKIERFKKVLIEKFKLYPKFKEFILKLKQKYKIALLTNNLPDWMPTWEKKFQLSKIFPIIITSFEEQIRKPDPEIYLRTCGKLNLETEECLFIDDQEKNVTGAKKAGLQAIQFTTEKETIEKIKKLLEQDGMLK